MLVEDNGDGILAKPIGSKKFGLTLVVVPTEMLLFFVSFHQMNIFALETLHWEIMTPAIIQILIDIDVSDVTTLRKLLWAKFYGPIVAQVHLTTLQDIASMIHIQQKQLDFLQQYQKWAVSY